MRILAYILASVASLALCGCRKAETRFVGMYNGEVEVTQSARNKSLREAQENGDKDFDVDKYLAAFTTFMELREDGTGTITATGLTGGGVLEGTWKLSDTGGEVTFRFNEYNGFRYPDVVFTASGDPPKLSVTGGLFDDDSTVIYTRT